VERNSPGATVPAVAGSAVLVAGILVLVGWALDLPRLQSLYITSVPVKANAALALVLGAITILVMARVTPGHDAASPLRTKPYVLIPAALMMLIGLLTTLEYAGNLSLGIDELLFKAPREAATNRFPGRMASIAALALTFLGAGLLTLDYQPRARFRISEMFLIGSGTLAVIALLGYAYGAIAVGGLGQGFHIAIPTAVCLILLVFGALFLRPAGGVMATFFRKDAGGMVARRLLPFAFAVPFCLGALRAVSSLTDLGIGLQSAIPSVLSMIAFAAVIWRTAEVVGLTDRQREAAQVESLRIARAEEVARARAEAEHVSREIAESHVRKLQGLLPICSYCKMVRNETNYWQQVDSYLTAHSRLELTHSICPDCTTKMLTEFDNAAIQ